MDKMRSFLSNFFHLFFSLVRYITFYYFHLFSFYFLHSIYVQTCNYFDMWLTANRINDLKPVIVDYWSTERIQFEHCCCLFFFFSMQTFCICFSCINFFLCSYYCTSMVCITIFHNVLLLLLLAVVLLFCISNYQVSIFCVSALKFYIISKEKLRNKRENEHTKKMFILFFNDA